MYASSRCDSPFHNSFKALAFGSVLIDPDRRHLAKQGEFYYGKALKAINKALKDPEYAYSDETLMSIFMCSLCEVSFSPSIYFLHTINPTLAVS